SARWSLLPPPDGASTRDCLCPAVSRPARVPPAPPPSPPRRSSDLPPPRRPPARHRGCTPAPCAAVGSSPWGDANPRDGPASGVRSEEHTSELQSRENLVCRRLLEKKKLGSGGGAYLHVRRVDDRHA